MRISNLQVQLLVNGETVFTYGDAHPSFVHSGGNVWTSFTSTGVLPADAVELRLSNFYANEVLSSFDDFFTNLSTGSEYPVYRKRSLRSGLASAYWGDCVPVGAGNALRQLLRAGIKAVPWRTIMYTSLHS